MGVKYNNQPLIPAPLVQIQRQMRRIGTELSSNYNITLNGTIVNVNTSVDSPAASGGFGMSDVLTEQARIRSIFGNTSNGGYLQITSPDASAATISAYCSLDSLSFQEGVWVNKCNYTATLSTNSIGGDSDTDNLLDNASENWNVQENTDGSWNLVHSMSATGKYYFTGSGTSADAMSNAKSWINSHKYTISNGGILTAANPTIQTFKPNSLIVGLPASGNYWNYSVVEQQNLSDFTVSLSESMLYSPSGQYRENWSTTVSIDIENAPKINMGITGEVLGLTGSDSDYVRKSQASKTTYETIIGPSLYNRLNTYTPSGYVLSPIKTVQQTTYNYFTGAIQYNNQYNAFLGGNLIPNAVDETISVGDSASTDIFASIPIAGRQEPLLQNMFAKTSPERTITINCRIRPSGGVYDMSSLLNGYLSKPNTNEIIMALSPNHGYFYTKSNYEEWNIMTRTYSRQYTYVLQPGGSGIQGMPSGLSHPAPY